MLRYSILSIARLADRITVLWIAEWAGRREGTAQLSCHEILGIAWFGDDWVPLRLPSVLQQYRIFFSFSLPSICSAANAAVDAFVLARWWRPSGMSDRDIGYGESYCGCRSSDEGSVYFLSEPGVPEPLVLYHWPRLVVGKGSSSEPRGRSFCFSRGSWKVHWKNQYGCCAISAILRGSLRLPINPCQAGSLMWVGEGGRCGKDQNMFLSYIDGI